MISTIFYFIVALGVLVFVHELGHFLVAKRAGIRVERFSLGYPPKMIGFQYGETEYCISWIPFGGYVKVAGMADVGTEETTGAAWEFPSKPIWVRMAVIAAGPLMNFLFAFFALFFFFKAYGIDTFERPLVEPAENSPAAAVGLRRGDRVLSVDGRPVANAYQLVEALEAARMRGISMMVERDAQQLQVSLPAVGEQEYGLQLFPSASIGRAIPDMPAEALGLRRGDRVLSVDGRPVLSWNEMSAEIRRHPGNAVQLVWERDGRLLEATIVPKAVVEGGKTIGQIGIAPLVVRHDVPFGKSIVLAFQGVYRSSYLILDFLGELFRGDRSTDELGGPLRIAQLAGQTAREGFSHFLSFLAMLSVNLAIINLFPIPVLDGGHLFFLLVEAIRRRPLSLRQREISQQIGLVIMLLIMLLVTFNDLNQLVFHRIVELFR